MKIRKFEDVIAWQKAQDFAVDIYKVFSPLKDFGVKDQILRASVSISNNIAEGFDRMSNAEFIKFLYYSLGSCSEVRSLIYLAKRLNYISEEQQNSFLEKSNELSKIMTGFIKSISPKTNH